MKIKMATAFVRAFVCLFLMCGLAIAQTGNGDEPRGKNEIQIWGGASPASSTVFGFGVVENARLGILAVRYARRFNNGRFVNLKYTVDAIPLAILSVPRFRNSNGFRQTAYSAGVSPLGLQMNFLPRKRIQPFFDASGGLLIFNKAIPNDFGRQFNFTAHIGGGVEFRLKKGRAFTVGYKYFHISNGNRGSVNPGIDNNLIYAGYSFSK
ncbi:MAG: acyloxyacyl hydrolase [Pyrinomonadaceae bacterium]|nr:acyloxyacyl hydrolase [Pyrinomonadaceae bacterium]